MPPGQEGVKAAFRTFWDARPVATSSDQIAEGDKVGDAPHAYGKQQGDLPGIPHTGNDTEMTATRGPVIHRIADGKLVEKWSDKDLLRMLQQLEVIPSMGPPG